MLNHGISTGALFILAGVLYERRHTYDISEYGGLATPMPVYATLFLITTLSSIGLPLLNGFIGEYLILTGSFQARAVFGILAATGVIWSACYMLWLYQRVFYGENKNPKNASLPDLNGRERASVWPLAIAAVVMGVFPMTLVKLHRLGCRSRRASRRTTFGCRIATSVPAPTVSPVQTAQENRNDLADSVDRLPSHPA